MEKKSLSLPNTRSLSRRKFLQSAAALATASASWSVFVSAALIPPLSGTRLPGYLAHPAGNGPFPAVVLVHEWRGLDDSIRTAAQKFVQAGFVVFAPDFYQGVLTSDHETGNRLLAGISPEVAMTQV